MNGKQRAYLRGLANGLETIVIIGKDGISANVVRQTKEALLARELIKCRVLEASLLSAGEACAELAEAAEAEGIQVIGSRFVLYKANPEKPVIQLPKA